LEAIWTEFANINNISKPTYQVNLDKLRDEYEEIFRNELGHCICKAKLHVKPEASPKFYLLRPILLAMKEKVEEELNRLTNSGVISQVQTSEWATPTYCFSQKAKWFSIPVW